LTILHLVQRHPFAVSAFFRHSLVLTYAYPAKVLAPPLPPGLALDSLRGYGFLTIALVQAERLHPAWLPAALGRDVFLAGCRIFARRSGGQSLRGLRILRSLTDRPWMWCAGNLFTHYQYGLCRSELHETPGGLGWRVHTRGGTGDLDIEVPFADRPAPLPDGSPFVSEHEARRYAGPLPYTFDYEPETHSIVSIRGVRSEWKPRPVRVVVRRNTFLDQPPFRAAEPLLANAFYLRNVPYRWERGVRTPLGGL
jgi:hypothetical protein